MKANFKDGMRDQMRWPEKWQTKNGTSHPVLVRKVSEPDEETSKLEVEVSVGWRSGIQSKVLE